MMVDNGHFGNVQKMVDTMEELAIVMPQICINYTVGKFDADIIKITV